MAAVKIPISQDKISHLGMYISDEDEFADDPHQIIPIEDTFALPYLQDKMLKGSTLVTSYQQRSLDFEEPTIMSQVM